MSAQSTSANNQQTSALTIFLVFLRLGLTSFGGPVAHLSFFREAFVEQRKWLSDAAYAELVALCQFLPGPASSQVGLAIGLSRGGFIGSLAAWAGFTLPSAILLIAFAMGLTHYTNAISASALHGLKLVAVPVVAQAVWAMAKTLCPDWFRRGMMIIVAVIVIAFPSLWVQLLVIITAALIGLSLKREFATEQAALPIKVSRRVGWICSTTFLSLLCVLPLLNAYFPNQIIALLDAFYRAGALVFGGGHVVLPLLQAEVVPTQWVNEDTFLAGYGAAQAVPGPLFTFAAFLGASLNTVPTGILGGLLCLFGIFIPSFLLVFGVLPFWQSVRQNNKMRAALSTINAAVVGLLLAALYHPVLTNAIVHWHDVVIATIAFIALNIFKLPAWLVVIVFATGYGLATVIG